MALGSATEGVPLVAIPKTMDNDVRGTEYCIGFSTAVTRAKELINRQRTTLGSHERIGVFRIFGRNAGYSAWYAAYVTSARCVIPEAPFDLDALAGVLADDRRLNPSGYAFVIASEGAMWTGGELPEIGDADAFGHRHKADVGYALAAELRRRTGIETVNSDLTYDLRSGDPDALDQMVAITFANVAMDLLADGVTGRMVAIRGREVRPRRPARSGPGRAPPRRRGALQRSPLPAALRGQARCTAPPRRGATGVSEGIWDPPRRLLTIGLIGLITAVAFEGLAVSTILPAVAADLDGLTLYGWAFSAFWLTNILGITLAGSDADLHGPRRAFIAGVLAFVIGLVVATVATGMPMLIAARAIQGLGSGAIGAVVYVVVARGYAPHAHPRMLAVMSTAWVVPGLIGPALAAWVASVLHWRWVFGGLGVPVLVLAAVALGPISALHAADEPAGDRGRRAWQATRLATGSLLFLSGLSLRPLWLGAAICLAGATLTGLAARRLLPAGALRLRRGAAAVPLLVFGTAFAFFGAETYIPLAVTNVRHAGLAAGALALSASTITWTAGSWLQARLVPRGWRAGLVGLGALVIALGIATAELVLLPAVPVWVAAIAWAISGLGMGLAYTTLSLLTLETAEAGREGAASATLQLTFTLGTAFGTGIGGAWVAAAATGVLSLGSAIGLALGLTALVVLAVAALSGRVPRAGRASGAVLLDPSVLPPVR